MTGFVPGNCIELLRSGAEYFPALEAACDAAQREIYLATYIFEGDVTGHRIAQALMRAARRGVMTHLLIDGFGSKDLGRDLLQSMRDVVVGRQANRYAPPAGPADPAFAALPAELQRLLGQYVV